MSFRPPALEDGAGATPLPSPRCESSLQPFLGVTAYISLDEILRLCPDRVPPLDLMRQAMEDRARVFLKTYVFPEEGLSDRSEG